MKVSIIFLAGFIILTGVFASDIIPGIKNALLTPSEPVLKDYREIAQLNSVNGYDEAKVQEYIERHDNFKDLSFKKIKETDNTIKLQNGPGWKVIEGIEVEDERIAIHVIDCDYYTKMCIFKINGVKMEPIFIDLNKKNSLMMNSKYIMELESVQYDYCGDLKFCDMYSDARDIVKLKVIKQ